MGFKHPPSEYIIDVNPYRRLPDEVSKNYESTLYIIFYKSTLHNRDLIIHY